MLIASLPHVLTHLALMYGPAPDDVQTLLDSIEILQRPVEDFRCEFEGTTRYDQAASEYKRRRLSPPGTAYTFSGTFIWKRGGDVHLDSLRRDEPDGRIQRRVAVIRRDRNQAEDYTRANDAPLGYAVIKNPKEVDFGDTYGELSFLGKLKQIATNFGPSISVSDDTLDGRPMKVLNVARPGVKDIMYMGFWIDLSRNGHVVKSLYSLGGKLVGTYEVELRPFDVGGAKVWMPVAGRSLGYADHDGTKITVADRPTSSGEIYVVDGTMEFNRHPGPEVFVAKYKPGTPISDQLRKLETQFGQQQVPRKPTIAQAESMLKEQVAKADEQKASLAVAPPSDAAPWWPWAIGGLATAAGGSAVVLRVQRGRRWGRSS